MRRLIVPVLIILLAACSNKNNTQDKKDTQQAAPGVSGAAAGNVYDFTGSINNKIPVSLWYAIKDSILSGELVYTNTKNKKPIRIIGYVSPEVIYIHEYLPDGTISGMWTCKLSGNELSGSWTAVNTEKELPVLLHRSEAKAHADLFSANDITGGYTYNYGEGGMGSVSVKKTGDHIVYNIQCVTASPANNLATVTDDTLALKGNEAVYKDKNEYGLCNYRIRLFKDFLIIDSPEDGYECGFGHNATVTGTFIKTSNEFTSYKDE